MKITAMLKNLLLSLYSSLKRFPAAIGFTTAATIILIILTHFGNQFNKDTEDILARIAMVLALGIPVSLCIRLLFERSTKFTGILKLSAYLAELIFLTLYYFFLLKDFKMVPVSRYIALSLAFYLAFVFIPYFFRRIGFELYVQKLFTRFFTTVLYAAVLFGGMSAIIFTLDKLLGVPIPDKLYFDMWLAIAGIFASCFFLAGVPGFSSEPDIADYSKLLKVLFLYIVMPILSIYTIILYLYFAKIILTLQWPVGLVSHLVLWYAVVSASVIFFISPLSSENKWGKGFIFWLSKLILPLIVMMFVSIFIRVRAYGITENRYFVILLGLWAFCMMAYLGFTRVRRNIVLVISLCMLAFLSVVGPWSSYSISKLSQNQRFEKLLSKYSMLHEGKIVKPSVDIPDTDKKEISQIIKYFSGQHELRDLMLLPGDFKTENMEELFGFSYDDTAYMTESRYFSYGAKDNTAPLDIQGYDYLVPLRGYSRAESQTSGQLEVRYDHASHQVRILTAGKEIYKKSLADYGKEVHSRLGTDSTHHTIPEDMYFIDETERLRLKFIPLNVHGQKEAADREIKINSMEFYMLVDMK